MSNRPSRRVPRISKLRFPLFKTFYINSFQLLLRKPHLTLNHQIYRLTQLKRNTVNGLNITGNILTNFSIPTSSRGLQLPILIGQHNMQTINLQLHNIPKIFYYMSQLLSQHSPHARIPISHLLLCKRIMKRPLRNRVFYFLKFIYWLSTNSLRWRVIAFQIWKLFLKRFQLTSQRVIHRISHLWIIQNMIPISQIINSLSQLFCALHCFFCIHITVLAN